MNQPLPLNLAAQAADAFAAEVVPLGPVRLEARVSSADGMPLLCAVEAVLGRRLTRATAQELIWLNDAPGAASHVLRLRAFGPGNVVLARAEHSFAAQTS